MYIKFFVYGLVSLGLTLILTPGAIFLAKKVGAIDYPSERRVHKKPIPRLGGVAIYVGFLITTLLFIHITPLIKGLIFGATIVFAVGVYDDIKGVSPKVKLLGQIVAASVLLGYGFQIDHLTLPWLGRLGLAGVWGSLFVVFWVVSLVNTVNITDGLDGLAAGICFVASLVLLWSALEIRQTTQSAAMMAILAGACLGFLFFNFHPAKVFMGDSGSMFLGFVIAGVSIMGFLKTPVLFGLVLPLLALGMPLFDMTFAVIRRKWNGLPISIADRGHLHHRLLDMGLSHREAVLVLYLLSIILGGAALFASRENWQWALTLTLLVGVIVLLTFFLKRGHHPVPRRSGGK